MKNPICTPIRVRYSETDGQGVVHHANYMSYFELGRVEHLRANGLNYRDFEAKGFFLVVAHIECDYKAPIYFDDEIEIVTEVINKTRVQLEHTYKVMKNNKLVAVAKSTIVCVNDKGKVSRMPEGMTQ